MARPDRHDVDRGAVAQVVVKRVFGLREGHFVAASSDLEIAVAFYIVIVIIVIILVEGRDGKRRESYIGFAAYFLAASMVSRIASSSRGKPRLKKRVIRVFGTAYLMSVFGNEGGRFKSERVSMESGEEKGVSSLVVRFRVGAYEVVGAERQPRRRRRRRYPKERTREAWAAIPDPASAK